MCGPENHTAPKTYWKIYEEDVKYIHGTLAMLDDGKLQLTPCMTHALSLEKTATPGW